jgi:hypothetical protein
MNQNAFDKGYEIVYQPGRNGYATLQRPGQLPIIELNRVEDTQETSIHWRSKKRLKWYIRELSLNDDPINEALPSNWQVMKYRGFNTIEEFRRWVKCI